MDKNDILQLFLEEALERLNDLSTLLLDLEKNPNDPNIIQVIFRSAHTLKGNSTTVYNTIEDMEPDEVTLPHIDKLGKLTHALENLIMEVRDNGLPLTTDRIDVLFKTDQALENLLSLIESGSSEEYNVDEVHKLLKNSVESNFSLNAVSSKEEHSVKVTESNSNTINFSEDNSLKFQVLISCDEGFKHAFLALVYRDIEDKYENAFFLPSFDDLMEGVAFDDNEIFISIPSHNNPEEVTAFIKGLENVTNAFLISGNAKNTVTETKAVEKAETTKEAVKETIVNPVVEDKAVETVNVQKQPSGKPIIVNSTLRVATSRIDEVLKHVSSLVVSNNKLGTFAKETASDTAKELIDIAGEISQIVKNLQDSVMNIRMTPLEHIFTRFPRDVRNIAKEYNKKVDFQAIGGETEIDKSLLDELPEPLVHLIRNSIFHGIETPDERIKAGKNEVGRLTLSAKHERGFVVITVEDDGKGINVDKVVKKAIEKGILTEEKAKSLPRGEKLNLIFHPGLSTADEVTAHAGRGVGMDAVGAIVTSMKGHIELSSEEGFGTTVTIRLPLTLAIIEAMRTKIHNEHFAFPLSQIDKIVKVNKQKDVKYVANKEIFIFREKEKEVPIIRLREFFGLEPKDEENFLAIILMTGNRSIAVTIDDCIGMESIVMKNIGKYLGNMPGISGCNILGDGSISLIADVNSIISYLDKK